MGRILIIGAGGVGTVVAHKCAQLSGVFTEIMLASRTKSKCDCHCRKKLVRIVIRTAAIDADDVEALTKTT